MVTVFVSDLNSWHSLIKSETTHDADYIILFRAIPMWNICLLSIRFIQWYCLIKSVNYLCEITAGETEWWDDGEGGSSKREQQINRARDGALDKNDSGMGQKLLLEKLNTWVFSVMQINRTNKLPVKLGGFQILQFLWCRNIRSHNAMFGHHTKIVQCQKIPLRNQFMNFHSSKIKIWVIPNNINII